MTMIVNFFGGPGVGKSTLAARLFTQLKYDQYKVELVPEYAKDLTWDGRHNTLQFQPYVISKQQYWIHRLIGQVDIVVTDSPTPLGCVYGDFYGAGYDKVTFNEFVVKSFGMWDNMNFLLRRGFAYKDEGRNQTEDLAKVIDEKLYRFLHHYGIPYTPIIVNDQTPDAIYGLLLDRLRSRQRKARSRSESDEVEMASNSMAT